MSPFLRDYTRPQQVLSKKENDTDVPNESRHFFQIVGDNYTSGASSSSPIPKDWSLPTISLRIPDLSHPGVSSFLTSISPTNDLKSCVEAVFEHLYLSPDNPDFPGTAVDDEKVRAVELVIRPFAGVAFTTGVGDKEEGRKEVHLSAIYVEGVAKKANRKGGALDVDPTDDPIRHEILGVLVHELVHCFQYNAQSTCPGGLIEGIADYVRLKAGLGARHWRPPTRRAALSDNTTPMSVPTPTQVLVFQPDNVIPNGSRWDAGYEKTGFFLEWIETRYGDGTIRELNAWMRERQWEVRVFKRLTGRKVDKLWRIYCSEMDV